MLQRRGSTGVPGNLFELLVRDGQEKHQKLISTWDQDSILLLTSIFQLVLLLVVLPATVIESFEFCCAVWVLHCFLVLTFGIFLELLCLLTIFVFYVLVVSVATDFTSILLAVMLLLQVLATLRHVLMFLVRRFPFFKHDVDHRNVHVDMYVIPGKDWMYDMKPEDGPQNAPQGNIMVGKVICDRGEKRWVLRCEVALWRRRKIPHLHAILLEY